MPRVKSEFYRPHSGDLWSGIGRSVSPPCRLRLRVNNVTVTAVIKGPYCVEQGAIFTPGPDNGEIQSDNGPGKVGC